MKNTLKKLSSLCFATLVCLHVNPQAPNWQWAKSIGGIYVSISEDVSVDESGNVYTTGFFNGPIACSTRGRYNKFNTR